MALYLLKRPCQAIHNRMILYEWTTSRSAQANGIISGCNRCRGQTQFESDLHALAYCSPHSVLLSPYANRTILLLRLAC